MRTIDLNTWSRRKHFETFNAFDYPHFNVCANVDITALHKALKEHSGSFSVAVTYIFARAANAIPEFRYRIRGSLVVEHEVIHPSVTILIPDNLFSFCAITYSHSFSAFSANAEEAMARVRTNPTLEDEPGQDNLLFMTSLPWVSFTSIMHPIHMHPVDSVPRIAWGKFFPENERIKLPLSIQAHHALLDGFHLGQYFAQVQELLDQPRRWLDT